MIFKFLLRLLKTTNKKFGKFLKIARLCYLVFKIWVILLQGVPYFELFVQMIMNLFDKF